MAYVISPDGKRGTVPDDELELALKSGYTLDKVRADAAEHPVRAFAERAASTLTLGASDEVLAGAMGAPYKDRSGKLKSGDTFIDPSLGPGALDQSGQLKERAEANPKAAFLGSLGGAVVNPVGRISSAAKTVKAALALGALEGGVWGLGSAITADALGDHQALTEGLAAHIAGGAVAGSLTSAGVQSVLSASTRASMALEGAELPKKLSEFAANAGAAIRKDRITTDKALAKAGLDWKDVDGWARKNGVFNRSTSPDAMYSQLEAALKNAEADAGDALLKLDSAGPPDVAKVLSKVKKLSDDPVAMLADPRFAAAARREGKALGKQADAVPLGPNEGTIVGPMKWADLLESSRRYAADPRTRKLAQAIDDEVLQQAFKVDRDLAEQLERGLSGMKAGRFLRQELEGLDLDTGLGGAASAGGAAMAFGGPVAGIKAAAAVVAGQAARKRGPFVVAKALDALADDGLLKPVAESFLVQLKARLNTMPELLGPFRAVLENAAAEGAASALATHMELAQSEVGDQYLSTMGLSRESAEDVPAVAQKAAVLASMQRVKDNIEVRLGSSLRGLDRDARDVEVSEADFWKTYESVQKLVKEPVVDGKLGLFPELSMGVTAKVSEAAQYVDAKAPKQPDLDLPPALQQPWEPTPQEQADFLRVARAAFNPLDAIESVMYGEPAQKTLETLSALYPRLLDQAMEKMFERLNQDKPLTMRERQRLEPFLGPAAVGLQPAQVQALAAVHEKAAGAADQGSPRVDGRQAVNQNKNYETQSQRIEARRSGK